MDKETKKDKGNLDNIDQTIDAICNQIQVETENYLSGKRGDPASSDMVSALAELITAKANLAMAVRMYASGSSHSGR